MNYFNMIVASVALYFKPIETLVIGAIAGFVFFDGYQSVRNTFDRVRLLKNSQIPFTMIVSTGFRLATRVIKTSVHQYFNHSVVKLDKNRYRVSYTISGHIYTFNTRVARGPSNILMVFDQNGDDFTDAFLAYYGPNRDFHGVETRPQCLGRSVLKIEMADGTNRVFNEDDIIKMD